MNRLSVFKVFAALAVTIAAGAGAQSAAPLPLHPFRYREGFEGAPPKVSLWATNGKATVRFLGPATDRAAEGTRALKLDVRLDSGSYWYWGASVPVPCTGRLRISAKLYVDPSTTARVAFGTNRLYPPTRHSGCGPIRTVSTPAERGRWQSISADLVTSGEQGKRSVLSRWTAGFPPDAAGCMLDRWAIFIYGKPGDRAVLWLDDVRIEGDVPDTTAYLDSLKNRFNEATAAFRKRVAQWRAEFATGAKGLDAALTGVPAVLAGPAEQIRKSRDKAEKLLAAFAKAGYATPWEVGALEQSLKTLRHGPEALVFLRRAVAKDAPVVCLANNRPVEDVRFAPDSFPLSVPPRRGLECSGCRGEFEPVSLLVFAVRDAPGLVLTATDLTGPEGAVIPASAVDIRVVKWWYQGAGRNIGYNPKKELKAELLLYDDALVRVDRTKQENYLRSTAPDGTEKWLLCSGKSSKNLAAVRPRDATSLKPLAVKAGTLREFWITVRIPDNASSGAYRGAVVWRTSDGRSGQAPLRVTVHPFDLAPSPLIYSIYYRAKLSKDGKPTIGSETKSEQQYRAEVRNMRDHGVLYPSNYQGWDEARLPRVLEVRRELGLPTDAFFNLGRSTGNPDTPEKLAELGRSVKKWLDLCREYGYRDVYFYGIDEAKGKRLLSQQAAWRTVQEAGGKTFVACYLNTFENMGRLLNCAVLAGPPQTDEARKWHSVGALIFCYANPQVGVEDPEIYRRNFGLRLWKADYDGAMDYAYQHGFHHVWNDFDDVRYRDHNFTYPTMDGVVDTIEWEGFREAVDDVRYVATLERAARDAADAAPALAESARKWLDGLDPAVANLYEVRAKAVEWITRLRKR
ncbi:MAG: DUF4091 domain-containing protein [Kiritimatiellaeota bacterium]|nr:DUF4091 domain-containing protein [Kiritimatiellota bacterium]